MKPDKILKELKIWLEKELKYWKEEYINDCEIGNEWYKGYDRGAEIGHEDSLNKIKELEDEN